MKREVAISIMLVMLVGNGLAQAQDDSAIPVPLKPNCAELENVVPDILIGGNITMSLGGLDMYQAYIDQARDSHLLSLEGEQMFGDSLSLEGCFVDETAFILTGELGNTDVIFVGVAIEPDFSEPAFGGLWYGWTKGYDVEVEPDSRGFFFKLF